MQASLFISHLVSQQSTITFETAPLDEVLKSIEAHTDAIFNYNPQVVREYYYNGTLDISDTQESIIEVLYNTPLDFTINTQTILIYLSDPKTYRICGTILDSETQEPLIAVNVSANNTIIGTYTDAAGYFELSMEALKNQKISVSYIGYKTAEYSIQSIDSHDCVSIVLSPDDHLLNSGIIITDFILDGISEDNDFNGYVMDYRQLSKHHSIVEHDILKTAQLLPGIVSIDESATNLQIRGGTSDQNLILWEGAPIYQPGHLFGMISAINPFSINDVNIHKGVYDPKYDNRVGGIIDISLTDSIQTSGHGSLGMTLTEAHFNWEWPIVSDKLEVFLSGRQSINTLFNSPPLQNYTSKVFQFSKIDDQSSDAEEGTIYTDQGLNFYDWNTKLLYRPVPQALINVGYYKNSQDFKYQLSFPDDPFIATDNIRASSEALKTQFDWAFHKSWTSSISYIQSKYKSDYGYFEEELGSTLTTYNQTNSIIDRSFTLSNNINIASIHLSAGYDYNVKDVDYNVIYDNDLEPFFEDINFEKGSFHNLFASGKWNHNKLHISGGLRSSYYIQQKRWVQSPRISLHYFIANNLKFKTEAGVFHQFISQLRNFGSNEIAVDNPLWILNDDYSELSQKANKFSAGFNYNKKGWLIDLEGFYNETEGLTTFSPIFNLLPSDDFSSGSSRALGLALIVKKRWRHLNSWVNYALGKIKYTFPEISEASFTAPNDIRHNLTWVGSYTHKDLQFSIISNLHSGLPYTQPAGVLSTFDEEDNETYYNIEYQSFNEDRLKAYARVDVSINYRPTFQITKKSKLEISLSILNLLNTQNTSAREYFLDNDTNNERPQLSFIRKSLLGRTPLMMCRIYW